MNAIEQLLKEKGITQAEFGKKVGVNQSMVGQWVRGMRPISIEKALMIEAEFGLQAEDLNQEIKKITDRTKVREQKTA